MTNDENEGVSSNGAGEGDAPELTERVGDLGIDPGKTVVMDAKRADAKSQIDDAKKKYDSALDEALDRARSAEAELASVRGSLGEEGLALSTVNQELRDQLAQYDAAKPVFELITSKVGVLTRESTYAKLDEGLDALITIEGAKQGHMTENGRKRIKHVVDFVKHSTGGDSGSPSSPRDFYDLARRYSERVAELKDLNEQKETAIERMAKVGELMEAQDENYRADVAAWEVKEESYESRIAAGERDLKESEARFKDAKSQIDDAKAEAAEMRGQYEGAQENIVTLKLERNEFRGSAERLRTDGQHKRQLLKNEIQHLRHQIESFRTSITLGEVSGTDDELLKASESLLDKADDMYRHESAVE